MRRLLRHPWLVVAVIGAITVFFSLFLPRARLDNNSYRFIPEDNPARLAITAADRRFGGQVFLLVGIQRRYRDIFDAGFLTKIRQLGERIESIATVDTVTSIMNTDYVGGSADAVEVSPLVPEDFSGGAEEIAALKARLLEWDLYQRALVSEDFRSTQILVSLEVSTKEAGSEDTIAVYNEARRFAEETGFGEDEVYITGIPAFTAEMNNAMRADLAILIPLIVCVVLTVLFLSFRRVGGVVLPLLAVLVSAVWAVGLMSLLGVKLTMVTTVLPVILVAVGSAYGIHVVSHFYDEMAGREALGREERRESVARVLDGIGSPVFLAALTTLAGFASLCFTQVVPIFELGAFLSFGVLVAYVVAVTLIPALLVIRGAREPRGFPRTAGEDASHLENDSASRSIADGFCAVAARPRLTFVIVVAVALAGIWGASEIVTDSVFVEYFRPSSQIVRSDAFIRESFGGSTTLSVIVSGSEKGDVLSPEILGAMDDLERHLTEDVAGVGKVSGFTDVVKRVNRVINADVQSAGGSLEALQAVDLLNRAYASADRVDIDCRKLITLLAAEANYKGAAFSEIPRDPARYGKTSPEELKALVGNYLLLLSGDLGSWADDPLEPMSVRMNVQLRTVGTGDTQRVVEEINAYVGAMFPERARVEVVGPALVERELSRLVVSSQMYSVLSSLVLVFVILSAHYRSLVAGVFGLVPLSVAVIVMFGVMGIFGIKLNLATAMVASITVGVGIDYIVHYMASYRRECLRRGDPERLLRRTFLTSGKAIVFNAASVGAGFAVLLASQFRVLTALGGLIAVTMGTSALASLTLLPAMFQVFRPRFIQRTRVGRHQGGVR